MTRKSLVKGSAKPGWRVVQINIRLMIILETSNPNEEKAYSRTPIVVKKMSRHGMEVVNPAGSVSMPRTKKNSYF